ncbi:MAG: CBS domain-containing protein [Acidobacteriales bacterium]|nr:CBS domain-containing protein [Terriglobales bacterium]
MLVRDLMTQSVTSVPDTAMLLDAALVIRRTGKRHVPVVSAQTGKVVGIITERDVSRLSPSILSGPTEDDYNKLFETTPVASVMTKNPITIAADAPVSEAVQVLYEKRIGGLLVVDNGDLSGIITVTDMLNLLNEMLAGKSGSFSE